MKSCALFNFVECSAFLTKHGHVYVIQGTIYLRKKGGGFKGGKSIMSEI